MTSERIKEIQYETAYPESISVMKALKQVWNECEQELTKGKEKVCKDLFKKAFDAGRDFQHNINPYSGDPNDKDVESFTKWYNREVK